MPNRIIDERHHLTLELLLQKISRETLLIYCKLSFEVSIVVVEFSNTIAVAQSKERTLKDEQVQEKLVKMSTLDCQRPENWHAYPSRTLKKDVAKLDKRELTLLKQFQLLSTLLHSGLKLCLNGLTEAPAESRDELQMAAFSEKRTSFDF